MKKASLLLVAIALGAFLLFRERRGEPPRVPVAAPSGPVEEKPPVARTPAPEGLLNRPPPPAPAPGLSAAEKTARLEKIKRDYDEIRAKASADYSAAGNAFPGGLNAFLRQLALLEREKRADFATFLTPRELEELELRETAAGQLVQRLLGPTEATEEQRRGAFRLQREFEERFALTFDVSPAALYEREAARQQTQEKIRALLGDALFGAWLAGEGEDFAAARAFAQRQNLPATVPFELWRTKNDYTLRRLDLATKSGLTPEQRTAATKLLVQQTESRAMGIIGSGAWNAARSDVLRWLPRR